MKAFKYIIAVMLLITAVWSCNEEDFGSTDFVDSAVAPTNLKVLLNITADNTGLVTITPNSEGAVSYSITLGDSQSDPVTVKQGKSLTHIYAEGNYQVKVIATGITGLTSEITQPLLVSFKSPENLVVVIENDAAISKKVDVTATADYATSYDVYFGEAGNEDPVSGNINETVSYTYKTAGTYSIRVVAKSAAIQTTEKTTEFLVTEILQPLTAAVTPSTREVVDVISIFSDKYTPTKVDMFVTDWSNLTLKEEVLIQGNKTLAYRGLSYAGIITETSPIDASEMEYFHVDVWSTNVKTFKVKFVDFNKTGYNNGSDNIEFEVANTITKEGGWVSFDIPLSEFKGVPFTDINQIVIAAAPVGTVFLDNMYFWREATTTVEPLIFDNFEGSGTITTWAGDDCGMNNAFANPFKTGSNKSNTVLKYDDAGGTYANVRFDTDSNFDLTVDNKFTLKIYVPSSGITGSQTNKISLKLQNGKAGEPWAQQTEIIKTIALDTWQEVTFDFANDVTAGAANPLTRTDFNRIVLQVNGEGNNDKVIAYIDDFSYGIKKDVGTPPYATDNFEGSGTITTWAGDDCGMNTAFANPFKVLANNSNTVLKYDDAGGTYANVRFEVSPNFDMTAKSKFTLKIYVPSSGVTGSQINKISLKLQNGTAAEPWAQQTEIIKTIVLDAWQEVTFDFANDVTVGAANPLARTNFNRVVLQVNGEGNNDKVVAYIDDFNYHN